MKRPIGFVFALGLLALASPARADWVNYSRLANPKLAPPAESAHLLAAADTPMLWLAQRVIDREWGLSEDSTYRVVELPGYRSEGWALALSAAVPGAGQLYVGEGSGWWYLLAEAAGWTGRHLSYRKADRYARDAAKFVGDPYDSSSTWSFARYQYYTGAATDRLETLWSVDRDAFYTSIERDPQYLAGYSGAKPEITFLSFRDLRDKRDQTLVRTRYIETALIVNHLFAAWDAMRAARFHNLPLQRKAGTRLKLGERWGDSGPQWRASLLRNF
ncbi:MAG: hypothetical protein ABIU54_03345 [Candidatus Eisenbacteria bacterium]